MSTSTNLGPVSVALRCAVMLFSEDPMNTSTHVGSVVIALRCAALLFSEDKK